MRNRRALGELWIAFVYEHLHFYRRPTLGEADFDFTEKDYETFTRVGLRPLMPAVDFTGHRSRAGLPGQPRHGSLHRQLLLPHSSDEIPINLTPCEVVSFTVFTDTALIGGAALNFELFAADGTSFGSEGWSPWGPGQIKRLPGGGLAGLPGVLTSHGTAAPQGLPAYAIPKTILWDVFNYTVVLERRPRPGYNKGGINFDTTYAVPALQAALYGSLSGREPGQYFKIRLDGNQTSKASGFLEGGPVIGALPSTCSTRNETHFRRWLIPRLPTGRTPLTRATRSRTRVRARPIFTCVRARFFGTRLISRF